MLQSRFKKDAEKTFRATKVFTDRDEPSSAFFKSLNSFCTDHKKCEILVYYGVGGIGKTKLVRKLFAEADNEFKNHPSSSMVSKIYISLDAYDYNNPINVLISIRKQLTIDCSLFDYAFLQYSAKTKLTVQDISRKLAGMNGPVFDIINELLSLGMGSVSVPSNILRKSAELISDIHIKKKYKEEIAAIGEYTESDIYQRLPYYLGLSILNAAQKGKKHVLFMDSYESLLLRINNSALIEDSEEWLKEFFLTCESILIVMASREKVKWYEEDAQWNDYLNQHILERLSEEDSLYFLKQVPIQEENVRRAIVAVAQGVPLYLDMCVDIYANTMNKKEAISEEMFHIPGNKIIERYIRHLKDSEKSAIKVLSVVNYFSEELARYILMKENLLFSDDELETLFDKSIFVLIDENQKIYKIDESVRHHLLGCMELPKKHVIVHHVLQYISSEMVHQPDSVFRVFEQLFKIIANDVNYFKECMQELIKIMVLFVDLGYWCDIHMLVKPYINSQDTYLRTYSSFTELFYLRRSSKIQEANQFILENNIEPEALGNFIYLYEFLKIHIIHLSGKYDLALTKYKELKVRLECIRENIDPHTYSTINIKYIDLLFLNGKFNTALRMTNDLTYGSTMQLMDRVEILRVRGHIYRFNFMLQEAEDIYHSTMELLKQEKSLSHKGKIYNNLAETYCYINPEKALDFSAKSIEINSKIEAMIELGKTYAAASIACALLNRFEEAIDYAKKGIDVQKEAGYPSGVLFAKISLFISKYLSKTVEQNELDEILYNVNELMNDIQVYHFLQLPIYVITRNTAAIDNMKENIEWLDFNKTLNTIETIFSKNEICPYSIPPVIDL